MFASWAHPISFRYTEERGPQTRQMPPSITVVTQQDGFRMIIMATFGALGLILFFFLLFTTFLFHFTLTCYCNNDKQCGRKKNMLSLLIIKKYFPFSQLFTILPALQLVIRMIYFYQYFHCTKQILKFGKKKDRIRSPCL